MDYGSDDNCVTFIWKIDNFSHCTPKNGEWLTSPIFIVKDYSFFVDLYLRGTIRKSDCVGLRLNRVTSGYASISFVFSISTAKCSFENSKENNVQFCPGYLCEGGLCSKEFLLTVPDILKKRVMHSISDGDTLTVKCKIVKWGCTSINYSKIFNACTVINVKKTTYSWNIKTFISSKEKKLGRELNLYDDISFAIDVSWVNSNQDLIELLIRQIKANEPLSCSCTLSLLDKEQVLQSIRHEHWFENKKDIIEHVWNISFAPKRQLMSYPQQDTYFCLEFEISKGIKEYSGILEIQHGTSIEHQPSSYYPAASVSSICTQTPAVSVSSIFTQTPSESSKSWKDNLQRFYTDGTLSDVTIRTPTKEFPVHKALLCAQSEVFTAMFERNMKEKETGIIDIDDSSDETISKMLLYIYGGLVENLDWESALNLYSAAHKYRIAALCKQCLDFLKDHLSTLNFYECLHIADLYQDQLLKSVAQEFVMEHSNEVINSEEWTEFMKVNVSLAAETMRMCFKNSKNP